MFTGFTFISMHIKHLGIVITHKKIVLAKLQKIIGGHFIQGSLENQYTVFVYSVYQYNVCVLLFQLCPTLCTPMDHGPPGSSVHGILQVRILEWVAISL